MMHQFKVTFLHSSGSIEQPFQAESWREAERTVEEAMMDDHGGICFVRQPTVDSLERRRFRIMPAHVHGWYLDGPADI